MAHHNCIVAVSVKIICSPLKVSLRMQCLLDQLLLSRDEQGRGMSRKALRDELMTLLVAGQETSAILLGWACAFLARHPEVQQRAAEEAQQVSSRLSPGTMVVQINCKSCCRSSAPVAGSSVGLCMSCQECALIEQDALSPAM